MTTGMPEYWTVRYMVNGRYHDKVQPDRAVAMRLAAGQSLVYGTATASNQIGFVSTFLLGEEWTAGTGHVRTEWRVVWPDTEDQMVSGAYVSREDAVARLRREAGEGSHGVLTTRTVYEGPWRADDA